jgi:hypothetical protein
MGKLMFLCFCNFFDIKLGKDNDSELDQAGRDFGENEISGLRDK